MTLANTPGSCRRCAHRVMLVAAAILAILMTGQPLSGQYRGQDAVNFDWQQFGQRAVAQADARTRQRIEQSGEERARFVAAAVARQLHAMGIPPNTNIVERGQAWTTFGELGLGTCQHVSESLKSALAGAGIDERRLVLVDTAKDGARKLHLLDVNRTHVALAYLGEDGRMTSYDLWAHGGDRRTFDGFDQSVWNGQEVAVWSKVMENHGYGLQGCFDCPDDSLRHPYLFLETLEKHAEVINGTAPPGAVRFVVKDNRTGEPLAGARLIVDGAVNSPVEHIRVTGTTSGMGIANITGIRLGPYAVTTSHANCPAYTSGVTNLSPGETRTIRMVCEPKPADRDPSGSGKKVGGLFDSPPAQTKPSPTTPGGSAPVSSDDEAAAEYRALLPAVLQAEKKPWHTRIDIRANAVKQGSAFLVNYQTYCLIEQGPDKGKDHMCFEYNATLTAGELRTAAADFKRRLGR